MVRINFGKYKDRDMTEVPTEWLEWHLADCERKARDYRQELERRRELGIIDDEDLFPGIRNEVQRPERPMTKEAYKIDEAARITGFSSTTLYQEIREGRLAAIRIGRRQVIQRDDLLEWMRRMKEESR